MPLLVLKSFLFFFIIVVFISILIVYSIITSIVINNIISILIIIIIIVVVATKLYRVKATMIIFVFVLYCIVVVFNKTLFITPSLPPSSPPSQSIKIALFKGSDWLVASKPLLSSCSVIGWLLTRQVVVEDDWVEGCESDVSCFVEAVSDSC